VIETILRRPAPSFAAIGLVCAGLLASAARVQTDNTPEAWLPVKDPARDLYQAFRARFGTDTFVLAAVGPVELGAPEDQARVLALQAALAEGPGVARVLGPVRRGGLAAAARRELPGRLDLIADAVQREPGDRDLLLLQARANAAGTFLLDPDGGQALARLELAQEAALSALGRVERELAAALAEGASFSPPTAAEGARAPLFWWAFARGAELRARDQTLDLDRVDAVMRWLIAQGAGGDPFVRAGPHLYFVLRTGTVGQGLGGDREAAAGHLADARRAWREARGGEGAGERLLLADVLEAELLAPALARTERGAGRDAILAAQRAAYARFTELLLGVLGAAPQPGLGGAEELADAVARERARALLVDPESAGVLPPADAAPLQVPTLDATRLASDDPLAPLLLSDDRSWGAVVVHPGASLTQAEREALVAHVERTLKDSALPHVVAGPEVITHDLDLASARSFGRLFPLVLLVMAGVLGATLRSARVVAAVLATAGLAAGCTVGLLVLSGRTLNLIVVVTPAILAVLTTAYALHLVTRYLYPAGDGAEPPPARDRVDAWALAARRTVRPCLLTAVTTAAGFFSLCTSEIPPVRDLGLFAGFGALVSFGLCFSFLPLVLSRLAVEPRTAPPGSPFAPARAYQVAGVIGRRAGWILLATATVAALAVAGTQRLVFESNVLSFFPAEHRVPQAYAALEPTLVGLTPAELWLEGRVEQVASAEAFAALEEFLDHAGAQSLVTDVVSPLDAVRATASHEARGGEAASAAAGPSPAALAALLRARLGRVDAEPLNPSEAAGVVLRREADGSTYLSLRATLFCRTTASEEFHRLVLDLREALAERAPPQVPGGPRWRLTGAVPLLVRVQVLLVDTQLRSFALALAVVTLVLLVTYRAPVLIGVSLLPNVLPILTTLGAMGWVGVPLNTATVTVAGIALGLVVDDTIHFLHHYHGARVGGAPPRVAVASTMVVTGRPIATTTAAVALGFGAFVLSPFQPTYYFGGLIAVAGVAAVVCDLIALPALLLVGRVDEGSDGAAEGPSPKDADPGTMTA
jgi:predicted RND superfamily exporter protein